MAALLVVDHLSKHFKDLRAVDELSFSVPEGKVYGFLGQNGAGKSTTIRMLLTLIRPSHGSIRIFGKELVHHRKEILAQVGAIIEKPDLYKYLTALQNLQVMAKMSGIQASRQQLQEQLHRVGIGERAHSKVKTFSQGMKQRLGIACALIHRPRLIILDEPTNGLDPQGIADMRQLILQLSREEGKTILISSHLLSEIEMIADHMLIINKGKKIAEGSVSDLLHPADTHVQVETTDPSRARSVLTGSRWQGALQNVTGIELKMHRDEVPALNSFLVQQGIPVLSITARHSLEDYFLSLTTGNPHVAAHPN